MTQLDTGPATEPTGDPQATAPETPPASPPSEPNYQEMLQSSGYADFGTALDHAKQYRQANKDGVYDSYRQLQNQAQRLGYGDVPAMLEELSRVPVDEQPPAQQPAQTPPAQPQPQFDPEALVRSVTEKVGQTMEERFQAMRDAEAKAADERRMAEAEHRARAAEDDFARKALEEVGFPVPTDKPFDEWGLETKTLANAFYTALHGAKKGAIPQHLGDAQREDLMKQQASESQLAAAKQALGQMLHAMQAKAVANFATGQQDLPDGTLAGGPSGTKAPAKAFDQMTHEEQLAFARAAVPELAGR